MSTQIFRKAALERIASPEQLDLVVNVTDMRARVALGGLTLAAVAALVWGFAGSIPTDAPGQGILINQGGRVVTAMTLSAGTLAELDVAVGDMVQAGQVVATIAQAETELDLNNTRALLAEREAELTAREKSLERELALRQENLSRRRQALAQAAEAARGRIRFLEEQLAGRRELQSQGYTTSSRVQEAQEALGEAQRTFAEAQAELVGLDSQSMQANLEGEREINRLRDSVTETRRRVDELSLQLANSAAVRAPVSGRVTELKVGAGSVVGTGAPILSIETVGESLQAILYIPTDKGKTVQPGMQVRIAPATVKKEEFGTLIGTVRSVSAYPSTDSGIAAVVQNETLVREFTKKGAPYEARVDLVPASTPSGFTWTSGSGPEVDLTSGTMVAAEITVRRQRPVELILPFFRKLLGQTA